jgi:hypothetical protein
MHPSRRTFLGLTAGLALATAVGAQNRTPQPTPMPRSQPTWGPDPPPFSRTPTPFPTEPQPLPKSDPRQVLKANQEDIKKDVDRLSELVSELRKGLDDGDTKDVLSLDVIHKTEEIEKLAKQIRGLVRG